jgi:hypothetical protein
VNTVVSTAGDDRSRGSPAVPDSMEGVSTK